MRKIRLLAADDEISITKFLKAFLEARDFEVVIAADGYQALAVFETEQPDLVLLDINMPGLDGFEVCQRIREWSKTPIIMLSARGESNDIIKCLELGADDYITKPFVSNELFARIKAVLRRTDFTASVPSQPTFSNGNLEINFVQRKVTVSGREIKLTPTEYSLLQEFVLNAEKVLTHAYLLKKVWGPEYSGETEYLHVFVRRLRTKLEADPNKPARLLTVSGVGYQFKET